MKMLSLSLFLTASWSIVAAQALPTASRRADLQAGITFSSAQPDYGGNRLYGYGFFADLDVWHNLGAEIDFHQLSGPNPVLYERTYEVGLHYVHPIHERFRPYAKALYGRGVFNFPGTDTATGQTVEIANLAFNIYSLGGGLDLKIIPGLTLRLVDYEYQRWPSFPPTGLSPQVLSFGVAYHFHGGLTK